MRQSIRDAENAQNPHYGLRHRGRRSHNLAEPNLGIDDVLIDTGADLHSGRSPGNRLRFAGDSAYRRNEKRTSRTKTSRMFPGSSGQKNHQTIAPTTQTSRTPVPIGERRHRVIPSRTASKSLARSHRSGMTVCLNVRGQTQREPRAISESYWSRPQEEAGVSCSSNGVNIVGTVNVSIVLSEFPANCRNHRPGQSRLFRGDTGYDCPGEDYCEGHHLTPLAQLTDDTETTPDDLAIACANCHRIIPLCSPPLTIQELQSRLRR